MIEDSSGRALLLHYQSIYNSFRIVQVTGYDPNPERRRAISSGLTIDYGYDQYGQPDQAPSATTPQPIPLIRRRVTPTPPARASPGTTC